MPAAAPATSSVLRSALVRWKNCAISEPTAPPVMMIGPSAPNGPPEPIEMADESGLRSATLGLDAAAVDQDRLDRFRDAVPADALGTVARHHADDERAGDRHQDHEWSERVPCRRDERRAEALEEEQVGEESDQREQRQRDIGADDADDRWRSP